MSEMEGRIRMKYPYTIGAKIAQFPYKKYWGQTYFKFYILSLALTFPLYVKIHKIVNSPANVLAYEKIKQKEAEEHKYRHH